MNKITLIGIKGMVSRHLQIAIGTPARNRNYVYFTEKYKIKCERKFEVNPKNVVVGFSSKNCF